ncbi:ornithine cyclodeaminase family protein [Mesorhizobium shangrilense]|uniref:Ornithine cyclodeaminase family protein n=1 Tax=Mesorhizobium shangrilense TaxID=460060 RepID=A0ABV2DR97_9HYPH
MNISNATGVRKSAAEIAKGDMDVLILSEQDVVRLLDLNQLIDGLAEGFRAIADGRVQSPDRPEITVPGKGFSLSMPAWQEGMSIAVKIVNVFEDNLELDLPNHLALINLFDPATGAPLCIMDGTYITGIRTAASAVLSVRELARQDARTVTLVGAGVQGREHLRLLPLVRDFDEIRIASLHYEDAEKLARLDPRAVAVRDVEAAVRTSDVVCLASHSYTPVIDAEWIRQGTHVSSVGYAPPQGELPLELIAIARLFVETTEAFKAPPVGCAELARIDPREATLLGDMLTGRKAGRQTADEITVYKAMGIAMEDMVAAHIAYSRARAQKAGQIVVL